MTNATKKAHFSMETTKLESNASKIISNWFSDEYHHSFPPERLIKSYDGCQNAWSWMYFSMYYTHKISLWFISIIGRSITDDLPGWLLWCTSYIMPDHAYRGDPNITELFQRTLKLAVGSLDLKWYSLSHVTIVIPRLSSLSNCIGTPPTTAMSHW